MKEIIISILLVIGSGNIFASENREDVFIKEATAQAVRQARTCTEDLVDVYQSKAFGVHLGGDYIEYGILCPQTEEQISAVQSLEFEVFVKQIISEYHFQKPNDMAIIDPSAFILGNQISLRTNYLGAPEDVFKHRGRTISF